MKLNEAIVKALPAPKAGNKLYYFPDAALQGVKTPRGFAVRVTAAGVRSFVMNYRAGAVERRLTIGRWPDWSVLSAVREARELRQRIDRGDDPLASRRRAQAAATDTLRAVCAEYFQREGGKLRSAAPRQRTLERLVLPVLGDRDIASIRRSDVIRMLDGIADSSGPVMANRTKAYLSRILTWHAGRSDTYSSPIVRGMGYSSADEEARQRVLTDDELRRVWRAATAAGGPYGSLIRFLLLTGARRGEAAEMVWQELSADWVLPAARNKTKVDLIRPLSEAAFAALPPKAGKYVFSSDGGASAIGNLSNLKLQFDLACGVTGWTLHDLRRTARSLMSRAGVSTDHAERCLGHIIGGVRGVYDVWAYIDEKRRAYEALAALIDRIIDPPAGNVVPFGAGAQK